MQPPAGEPSHVQQQGSARRTRIQRAALIIFAVSMLAAAVFRWIDMQHREARQEEMRTKMDALQTEINEIRARTNKSQK